MNMLALDSSRWSELRHAYGNASDVPPLLRALCDFPPDDEAEAEPYFSLWSALCHQGDVYTASFAAVPHLVAAVEARPESAPWTVLLLIASIETARAEGRGPPLPPDLDPAYREALRRVPAAVAATAVQTWDHWYCGAALAAAAAAKGFGQFAEAILELDPDEVRRLLRRRGGEDDASP